MIRILFTTAVLLGTLAGCSSTVVPAKVGPNGEYIGWHCSGDITSEGDWHCEQKTLKDGKPVALLIDQNLSQGDPITFMGRETRAPSAAIKLARRFDIPVIPTLVRRRDDGPDKTHFVQYFFPAFRVAQTDDMTADIEAAMRQSYDLFEQWIEERPAEWLWPYNRWK